MDASAQDSRLVVVDTSTKQLSRIAHRWQIPVENVRTARALIEEATEFARRHEGTAQSVKELASLWSQMHPSLAAAKIELLMGRVRTRAQEADDLGAYKAAVTEAKDLLVMIVLLDEEKALDIARHWPAPPQGTGPEGEDARRDLYTALRRAAQGLAQRDPERAVQLLDAPNVSEGLQYGALAQLASRRYREGRRDEALKLADRALSDFVARPTANFDNDHRGFIESLAQIDPGRALSAFESLVNKLGVLAPDYSSGAAANLTTFLRVSGPAVPLPSSETLLFDVLSRLRMRPELLSKALSVTPSELQAKFDQLGGVDRVFGIDPETGNEAVLYLGTAESMDQMLDPRSGTKLWSELRGKFGAESERIESILSENRDPRALLLLARQASVESPALASAAIAKATKLIPRVEPLDKRAAAFYLLLTVSRTVDGETDTALFVQGLRLVADLRAQDEKADRIDDATRRQTVVTSTDEFEANLLAEYARTDLEAALAVVRRLPEVRRLAALVRVASAFRRF
jgi:hypothetical protein